MARQLQSVVLYKQNAINKNTLRHLKYYKQSYYKDFQF